VGFLNPLLYSIASTDPSVYHDVTSGCSLVEVGSSTQTGYCAHPGWDFVTGWGSIDASQLARHLAPEANIVPEFPTGSTADHGINCRNRFGHGKKETSTENSLHRRGRRRGVVVTVRIIRDLELYQETH
jgi:hypothetical protein